MECKPPAEGRRRVAVEGVHPELEGGRFPIKRTVGERVRVEADVFADGHDLVAGVVRYRAGDGPCREVALAPLGNDRWFVEFAVEDLQPYSYTVEAWIDRFGTWAQDLRKRIQAGQDVRVELLIGAGIVRDAAGRAEGTDRRALERFAEQLETGQNPAVALYPASGALAQAYADRSQSTRYGRELRVLVDRPRALFGAWYELFPRSAAQEPGRHGSLRDVEARLPYIASMGFDVVYLPPIHPIGRSFRKGPNNSLEVRENDPGSPWAIGGEEGGHVAIHPQLGTLADLRHLVAAARRQGMELALDLAFQASPDHPWVKEHPSWFRSRPDGTIQYAENPPKKYQDIYPFDFESADWCQLWQALLQVILFWAEQGIRIFRVDNPHTKAFPFWDWAIACVRARHPDVLFLSEAFTRPRVMYRLAKLGFDLSYTYFAWRNTAAELREYVTELTRTEVVEYFRPSFWTNTQDILTATLQDGGRPASALRFLLAATLSPGYGIFGPAFELVETTPLERGREEYLHSEKYEVRYWDLDQPQSLRELIGTVNGIRRAHPALQQLRRLRFLGTDNDQLLAFVKEDAAGGDRIVVVVNLDPHWRQSGFVDVPVDLTAGTPYRIVDLLGGAAYQWRAGEWSYVELDPGTAPGHVLHLGAPLRADTWNS